MRLAWTAVAAGALAALVSCGGVGKAEEAEEVAPLKLLGPGVPPDLPALKPGAFAVFRLGLNG